MVNRTRVVDPRTGKTVLRLRGGVIAAVARKLLVREGAARLALVDAATRAKQELGWPSVVGSLDTAAVDPRGRFIAIGFANPAWHGGGDQVLDVWVLDTNTRQLRQLPGMPAFVLLKFTSMAWTADRRLVLLGEEKSRQFVAVWRPGRTRVAIKTVQLRPRRGGSDTFAPLG